MTPARHPAKGTRPTARTGAPPPDLAALAPAQLDLFPVKPVVDKLEPRTIVGPRTGVEHLVRVRLRPNDAPHLVFHDRHGWYCESHGPACHAVSLARADIKDGPHAD
jgi:hypothetical protein